MCGIIGVIGHSVTEEQLQHSIRALKHRGPDGNGTYIDQDSKVALAHTRLSIIDLAHGAQPLMNKDQTIALVVNGEIYDFERIRSELTGKGHNFLTKSDSEVVLHLYEEYGPEGMFEHLRGEFAFILYDIAKKRVIVGRDRFGIKPLSIAEADGKFIFSSEAKGIFATGLLKPEINPVAIRDMLSFVPMDSIFKGIISVQPGSYLDIDLTTGSSEVKVYWDVDLPKEGEEKPCGNMEECIDIVRKEFDEAVRHRMRADVPVGVYLSGGIDSAAVAGTIAKQHPNELHAFTIAFTDSDEFNELVLAKKMAESIGARLHVATCDNESLLENMEDCLWFSEIPTPNLHGVGKFMLSKLARKQVKVVLTGEGSDETFLGYDYFKDPSKSISKMFNKTADRHTSKTKGEHMDLLFNTLGFVPQQEMLNSFTQKMQDFYVKLFEDKHKASVRDSHPIDLLKRRIKREQVDGRPLVRKIQYFSIRGLMSPYILSILGDRQEMAHAIEGRTPLLDHNLFEKARHIPDAYKIHNGIEKYVFRKAMEDRVIPDIFNNKKWPYSAPPLWIRDKTSPKMKELVHKYLSNEAIEKSGIFSPKLIKILKFLLRWLPFDGSYKRRINILLMFVLNVQILQDKYEQEFNENVEKYSQIKY